MPAHPAQQPVSVDRARAHLILTLAQGFGGGKSVDKIRTFLLPQVPEPPYEVYDLDGPLLFYLFPARLPGSRRRSWVRAAASKIVGPAIVSIETPLTPWDPGASLRRARSRAQKRYGDGAGEPRLVSYSYPHIGVLVPLGDSSRVIYDAHTLEPVSEREPGDGQFGARSYLRTVSEPEAEERLALWELDERRLPGTDGELDPAGLKLDLTGPPGPGAPGVKSGLLRYSRHGASHDCFALYPQEKKLFCTAACAQMILHFYRYDATQPDLAKQLKIAEKAPLPEPPAEKDAYEWASRGGLVASIDEPPQWDDGKAEIEQNRPFRDAIEGHTRVCTGWMEEESETSSEEGRKWLRLHDPQPGKGNTLSGGQVVWERWVPRQHFNFIRIRHREA